MRRHALQTTRPAWRSWQAVGSGDRPCRRPPHRSYAREWRRAGTEGRTLKRPAGQAAIVIVGPDQLPALVGLVLDIGDRLRSYGSSTHIGVTLGSDHVTSSSDC